MNKELIVILLRKDIKELMQLTEGFVEMDRLPQAILELAKMKAENIVNNLNELNDTTRIVVDQTPAMELIRMTEHEVEINSTTEPDIISESENNINPDIHHEEMTPNSEPSIQEQMNLQINEKLKTTELRMQEEFQEDIEVDEIIDYDQIQLYTNAEKRIHHSEPAIAAETHIPEAIVEVQNTAPDTSNNISLQDRLSNGPSYSLGDNIANQKISDIKQAINIGDRFRYQRELFGNNGEVMNKTIAYLNQLAKYEEAVNYLKAKFGWANDNPHATDFLDTIKKRY